MHRSDRGQGRARLRSASMGLMLAMMMASAGCAGPSGAQPGEATPDGTTTHAATLGHSATDAPPRAMASRTPTASPPINTPAPTDKPEWAKTLEDITFLKTELLADGLHFPDPATTDGVVHLSYLDPRIYLQMYHNYYKTDLSFLGIPDATVYDIAILPVTNAQSDRVTVRAHRFTWDDSYMQERILDRDYDDECVVLAVRENTPEGDLSWINHLIVLDYVEHRSYDILLGDDANPHYLLDSYPFVNNAHPYVSEETHDIILKSTPHKHNTQKQYEVFHLFGDGDGSPGAFQRIFSSDDYAFDPYGGDRFLTGRLLDGYQAVVECPAVGFSRQVSLLDFGFAAEPYDLEIPKRIIVSGSPRTISPDGKNADLSIKEYREDYVEREDRGLCSYWDGKLIYGGELEAQYPSDMETCTVYHARENPSAKGYERTYSYESLLKLAFRMDFGYYDYVCTAYAYFRYDPATRRMLPCKASVAAEL